MNERDDVMQVMAVVRLVGIGDQQALAGYFWRVRKPPFVEKALDRSVRARLVDDRLDRGKKALPERAEE